MNKNKLIQLNDYINDKSSLRLNIFVGAAKVNKKQLQLMIDDYVKDKSKQRLKLIENMLSYDIAPKKKNKLQDILNGPVDNTAIRRIELAKQINAWVKNHQGAEWEKISVDERKDYTELKAELYKLEEAAGMFNDDPNAQSKSEISILKGLLGDWTKAGSLAWQILQGNNIQFKIVSHIAPDMLIMWLEKHSGIKARSFHITNGVASGVLGKNGGSVYTFVDKGSGLPPAPSMTMTNEKGADMTNSLGQLGMGSIL